jgi:hypothetical protein
MPTISESELTEQWESQPCVECPDYEGAIWLCGEGYLCERCFAKLAGIVEEDLFVNDKPILDFDVPKEYTARVKANLMHRRDG